MCSGTTNDHTVWGPAEKKPRRKAGLSRLEVRAEPSDDADATRETNGLSSFARDLVRKTGIHFSGSPARTRRAHSKERRAPTARRPSGNRSPQPGGQAGILT